MATESGSFPDTRTTLIRHLADHSDERWGTFFGIYGPLVYRIARRAGLNENDAEEVLANVMRSFVQAVQRGFEVDHSVGLFRSYLKTMTAHEIAAWRRQQRKHAGAMPVDEVETNDDTPEEHWAGAERQQRWRQCLEKLRQSRSVRKRDFAAFRKYALDGEAAETVAADAGITANHLYVIKSKMMKKLHRIWDQLARELGEV